MTPPLLIINVEGTPATQGSHRGWPIWKGQPCRACHQRRFVRVNIAEQTGQHLHAWRHAVRAAAQLAIKQHPASATWPLAGPVSFYAVFTFDRPKSHFGTGRNSAVLKPAAPAAPVKRTRGQRGGGGDMDKLLRGTFDSLTEAGVWHDDSQVAHISELAKLYLGQPGAGPHEGALIIVTPYHPARSLPLPPLSTAM